MGRIKLWGTKICTNNLFFSNSTLLTYKNKNFTYKTKKFQRNFTSKFHAAFEKLIIKGNQACQISLIWIFKICLSTRMKKVTNVGKNLLFWIHFWSSFCLQNGTVKCCGGSPAVSALIFLLKCRPKNFDKSIQIRFLKSFRSLLLLTEMSSRLVGCKVFMIIESISHSFS